MRLGSTGGRRRGLRRCRRRSEPWTMVWAMSPQKRILRWSGGEVGDDLLHEVEVDGPEAAGVDVWLGLAEAEVDGLVCADVEEGAGIELGELGEHLVDEGEGAGLAGGEDGSRAGVSARGWYCSVEEVVVEVAEGFLVRDDGDVVLGGVGDEGSRASAAEMLAPGMAKSGFEAYCWVSSKYGE